MQTKFEEEIDPTTPPVARLDKLMGWIREESRDPAIVALSRAVVAHAIHERRAGENDPVGHLQAILDWQAKAVKYVEDPTDDNGWQKEIFKRPSKSIADGGDDCDGKATVYCTMAWAAGYPSMPAWIEQTSSRNNHIAGLSLVPLWAASRLPPAGEYDAVLILPSDPPREADSAAVWAETTLGDVMTPRGIVRGPRIGEHPFDVVQRFRREGISRLHL